MIVAEVAYTTTNTQSSCSGGGQSDRVSNTFKEAMDLPQAARWKTASDKQIASLKKHGVFNLVPITSVPAGRKLLAPDECSKFRWTVPARVASSCKDFRRSLASTAALPSLPFADFRASALCPQSRRSWTTRCTC